MWRALCVTNGSLATVRTGPLDRLEEPPAPSASNMEGNALTKSEQAIHEIQQCHLHDVWDKNITPTCEGERIGHDTGQRGLHPLTSRPHRIVHEIPRKHTINGYAYDV